MSIEELVFVCGMLLRDHFVGCVLWTGNVGEMDGKVDGMFSELQNEL